MRWVLLVAARDDRPVFCWLCPRFVWQASMKKGSLRARREKPGGRSSAVWWPVTLSYSR